MLHAINAWLARLARQISDSRLTRDNQIAAANRWQVQRASRMGTYGYRDPRFDTYAHALTRRAARHDGCGYGPCRYGYRDCTDEPLEAAERQVS